MKKEDKNKNGALLWKIEKIVSKGDYDYAVVHDHPKATKYGYVLHHRVVMENHLGRLLKPTEVVHHIDENKKNNLIDNLEVMSIEKHSKLHANKQGKLKVDLKCPECKKLFTRSKNQSFLQKGSRFTCCSRKCSGKFSRKVQLEGRTQKVEDAISENLLRVYRKHKDNSEEIISQ